MPDELLAGDTTTPTTLVESPDLWELEDVGRVRATPEEVARDLAADFDTPAPPMPDGDGDTVDAPEKPEQDVRDHDTLDEEETDDDPPAPKAEEPKPAKENKRGLDGRIKTKQQELGRIAAEVRAENARLARLRAEAALLEPAATAETPAAPVAAKTETPDAPALVKPVWKDYDEAGKDWTEFQNDLDAYYEAKIAATEAKIEQKLQATEQERVERDAAVRVDTLYSARLEAARAQHEDFEDAVEGWDAVPVVPFLRDAVKWHPRGAEMYYQIGKQPEVAAVLGSLTYTAEMMDAVMASPDPTAMLVYLAENPAEYDRLVQLPARQALVAFGALDARLQSAPPAPVAPSRVSGSRTSAVPVSKAKPPIRPVAGGSRPTSTSDDPDDMDFSPEYVKAMDARERAGRV